MDRVTPYDMFSPIVRKTFGLNRRFFLIFERLLASTRLMVACVIAYFILSVTAHAQIVALGASDVAGWFGVLHHQTWPAQLEEMLKAKGYNVQVKNAGKPGDTPWGLLRRLDSAVPSGTKIVILAKEGLYANNKLSTAKADEAMNTVETKLKSRGITIIPANAGVVLQNPGLRADDAHLNAAGHKELATRLLPLVIRALGSPSQSG
jgi:acyl-CoA thioesterase I